MHISKKCCNFAVESPKSGFRGWEVFPLEKPTSLTKDPSRGFQDILKKAFITLCSDGLKLRNFQRKSELSNGRCPTGYRMSLCAYWVRFLRIMLFMRACTLNSIARKHFYIRRGLQRCLFYFLRQCEGLNPWNDNSRIHAFFYMPMRNNIINQQIAENAENPIKSRQS